ncbi:MAG: hypothetical protein O3C40_16580 [Planctomycetota bacterium]|nr:hypothetical protein [Planctomycetota bacterium]
MATIQLTLEQIVDAAQQLPDEDRVHLISALVQHSRGKKAREALEELRPRFGMPQPAQRRMSALLAKSNGGTITAKERAELATLIGDFQQRSLELAEAVSDRVSNASGRQSPSRRGKR